MKRIICLLVATVWSIAPLANAEESQQQEQLETTPAYVVDDLFIYMHAGAGANYRIVGSVNAGDEIKLTGNEENGYTEFIDPRNRTAWVESKYISANPGLRFAIAELNTKLANQEEVVSQTQSSLSSTNSEISALQSNEKVLNEQIASLTKELAKAKSQVDNQDMALKKEYFFNGAIVLAIGILFGIVLPRLSVKKRTNMDSWK